MKTQSWICVEWWLDVGEDEGMDVMKIKSQRLKILLKSLNENNTR